MSRKQVTSVSPRGYSSKTVTPKGKESAALKDKKTKAIKKQTRQDNKQPNKTARAAKKDVKKLDKTAKNSKGYKDKQGSTSNGVSTQKTQKSNKTGRRVVDKTQTQTIDKNGVKHYRTGGTVTKRDKAGNVKKVKNLDRKANLDIKRLPGGRLGGAGSTGGSVSAETSSKGNSPRKKKRPALKTATGFGGQAGLKKPELSLNPQGDKMKAEKSIGKGILSKPEMPASTATAGLGLSESNTQEMEKRAKAIKEQKPLEWKRNY
jgi:hypothetical protein